MIRIIPRKAWTSTAPGGAPITEGNLDTYQHHTAGPQPKGGAKATRSTEEALIRGTRAYHVGSRDMADIAYSFGVMPSGRIYALRGRRRAGGHTFGHNSSSYGIVCFGNYESQKPPEVMIRSLRGLYSKMLHRGWVAPGRHPTGGHRDVGAQGGGTACPGKHLYARLDDIRRHHPHAHHPHPHSRGRGHHHRHGRHPHAKAAGGHHHD